jgi:uncharacterized membrane protein YbhN (UPF0104 family)
VKKVLFFLLKVVVSSGALYIILSKTDAGQIASMIKKIGIFYFFLAAAVYLAAQMISTLRWELLLPERFGFRKLFPLYLIGSFFSSFLPGLIGGDLVKAYYLNKDAKKLSLTLASVFMDRYLGFVSLMIIGIAAFPFALPYFGDSPYKWAMPVILAAFITGSLLFFGLRLGRRFKTVSEFYEYFVVLKSRKDIIIKAIVLSLIVQVLCFGGVGILAFAMGADIPLLILFVFLPIIITVTSVPISISGLGVREGAFVLLLGLIGVRPEAATSLSLSWFFSVFLGGLPGLAAYIRHTGKPGSS